jgi:hypothetical protein
VYRGSGWRGVFGFSGFGFFNNGPRNQRHLSVGAFGLLELLGQSPPVVDRRAALSHVVCAFVYVCA